MRVDRFRGAIAGAFLVFAVLLGGASGVSAGVIANAILQGLAVLLILWALWSRPETPYPALAKPLTWIALAFAGFVFLYLIPLPSSLWAELPGRTPIKQGLDLLGIREASLPLSLSPQGSLWSIVWLLPPVAAFLLVLQTPHSQRKALSWVVIGLAVVSVFLGTAQLLGGPGSGLRLYRITNPDLPVGFFANGNHLATLLLCSLPFAGYLAARGASASGKHRARRGSGVILATAIAIFLLVGIAIIGSLAGYGLAIPATVATLLIYRRAAFGQITTAWTVALGALFLVFVGLALSGPLDPKELAGELSDGSTSRKQMALNTVEAAGDFFPLGSGLGSFQDVYRTYADPDQISFTYINHAHNDYAEIALELGLPGLALLLVFFGWYGFASFKAWRSDEEGANLARAGSVLIGVVLFHSIVEYPIRTSAIACLFAVGCALMISPWASIPRSGRSRGKSRGLRHIEVD